MEQELISDKKIAIIGAGPCGCFCALNLDKNANITLFDFKEPLTTLLPTGGGRCNLAFAQFDFKELAGFYPRGEKFLYSVFSKFSTQNTIETFKKIGVNTYFENDLRVFPVSESSIDVREKLLNQIKHCSFKKERVLKIIPKENRFEVKTSKEVYGFDIVVLTTGTRNGFKLLENTCHTVIQLKPALVGLKTQNDFYKLAGVSVKNVRASFDKKTLIDDLLFTHSGVSGPLIFKISSIKVRDKFPYTLKLNFVNENIDMQNFFNKNPHKTLKNLIASLIPKSLAEFLIDEAKIDGEKKCSQVNSVTRKLIKGLLEDFELKISGTEKQGETVMSGGVSLDEIDSKTCMSKLTKNLYIGGEALNIDGFCGGFNLQNCWSTGFVISHAINKSLIM